ncbi:MAG: hypothetical protein JWM04_2352 [Verrucomicrobiales bacterium]|nr:hypothetical protein [Verrucomicrobiales bacterium]
MFETLDCVGFALQIWKRFLTIVFIWTVIGDVPSTAFSESIFYTSGLAWAAPDEELALNESAILPGYS